jgi:hypothetical protein
MTFVPQPDDPVDRALAQEAVAYVNAWAAGNEILGYLRNLQLGAVICLREGGDAARGGYLLSAAYAARTLTELSIRLAWIYPVRDEGPDAIGGRIQRLRALEARELVRAHEAIKKSSNAIFIKNVEDLNQTIAKYGVDPAPGYADKLAKQAGWPEQYGSYRLLSAMIHSAADGWVIAERYERQGGFLVLIRRSFSQIVAAMSNLFPLLQPNPSAPALPLNAKCLAADGKL